MKPRKKWANKEIEQLKQLWYEGDKTINEISIILNIEYSYIRSFISRNRMWKTHKWSDDELEILKEKYYNYMLQYNIGLRRKRIKYFWDYHKMPLGSA